MKARQIIGAVPRTKVLASGLLVAALIQGPASSAHASLLGEIVRTSAVGEPLLLELRSPGNTPEQVVECIRVFAAPGPSADLGVVRDAQLSVRGSGQAARLIVRSNTPAFEPIIQLTLLNICNPKLQREYTLFLEPPMARPGVSSAPTAPANKPEAKKAAAGPVWSTVRGESLGSIARALYPNAPTARRRFIDEVIGANPEHFADRAGVDAPLPRGTELRVPDLSKRPARPTPARPADPSTRRSVPTTQTPAPPSPPILKGPAPEPSSPNPASAAPGRLVIEGAQASSEVGPPPSPLPPANEVLGDDELAEREAALVAAIDKTINTQLELLERLRRLEQIQSALKAQLESAQPEPPPVPRAGQQGKPATATDTIPVRDVATDGRDQSAFSTNIVLAALAGLAILLALGSAIKRRRSTQHPGAQDESAEPDVSIWPDEAPSTVGERTPSVTPRPEEAQRPARTVEPLDFDTGTETPSPEAETLPPVTMADEPVEEHDSAVELADIMISFGRVHGAAETLADFIRSNPRQAVTPWLKLMEVYRLAGMRMEFDALARQLNKTFNVKAVTWDNFDDARKPVHSLEQMPHLIGNLTNCWGTRECQVFLEKLLRDNRDGLREGFPISIIDEILTLSSVLEEQIGRYRPDLPA